ncbi:MAG: hypothetical protein QGG25_08440, partial [Phycisphaerae bacterium]|nr:hypothetical protein [Phycisphaerae bacterium]
LRSPIKLGGLKTLRSQVADDTHFDRDYLGDKKPQFNHCGAIAKPYAKPRPIALEFRKNIAGSD